MFTCPKVSQMIPEDCGESSQEKFNVVLQKRLWLQKGLSERAQSRAPVIMAPRIETVIIVKDMSCGAPGQSMISA